MKEQNDIETVLPRFELTTVGNGLWHPCFFWQIISKNGDVVVKRAAITRFPGVNIIY